MTHFRTCLCLVGFFLAAHRQGVADDAFERDVRPLLTKFCVECHSGKDANGDVDFNAISNADDVASAYELWESVAELLHARTMPPEDEPQPTDAERQRILDWYGQFVESVEARPAVFRARRLSVTEYRNTLRSVIGFDLEVAIIEAEQTLTERSLVVKLLPTDPPGASGFKNDTHSNPLTTVVWDQYSYLVDAALEELFSTSRRTQLEALSGPVGEAGFNMQHAQSLIRSFVPRAWRRSVPNDELAEMTDQLEGLTGSELIGAVKLELKTVLMSPSFIYRGLLMHGQHGERQPVDPFELAERLSYFLWADMPDERLMSLAADGTLTKPDVLTGEIDRMMAAAQARSLAEVFAVEWFTLNEIEHVSNNPPQMVALKSQPIDFMHYLFTEDRPLLELVDSETAFISPHTARMYGADARQMKRYIKQKGIEVEIVPNQKISLKKTTERGGLLTMPGVLAMNRGPIIRGTWVLERILGEHLPEPPANVGQVPPSPPGRKLSFRERFEQHRSNPTCAVCHDKIDPLGFALQSYGSGGQFLASASYKPPKKKKSGDSTPDPKSSIDTSGQLPSGETFENINELKKILTTTQRKAVIRNIVKRTMSYALCRKLKVYDRPTVESIVQHMDETNGTWRDLIHAIANSVPFRETILSN